MKKQKSSPKIKKVTFRISESSHRQLKTEAARKGAKLNDIVIEALELYLAQKGRKDLE